MYDRTDEIIIKKLKAERDKLKAENEGLQKRIEELEPQIPKITIVSQEEFLKEQRQFIPEGWLEYPTSEPQDEGITWYDVIIAGGEKASACWWHSWYCFSSIVIAYKP